MKNLPSDAVYKDIDSPVGRLRLVASAQGLHALLFEVRGFPPLAAGEGDHPVIGKAIAQLDEYFAGRRKDFDLPLAAEGTEFQKLAWRQLQRIPYGETISYGEQAERLGGLNKMRAVGGANSRNPISIIVPCHRVVAKGGALHGFGGGLDAKKFLLDLETANVSI